MNQKTWGKLNKISQHGKTRLREGACFLLDNPIAPQAHAALYKRRVEDE